LRQWTDDVTADEGVDAKGLLVVNAFAAEAPGNRRALVAGDTLALTKRWHQSVLTTPQIFAAVASQQGGALDQDAFWETVMTTEGVCALPDPVSGDGVPAPEPRA
jgi:hypothetical protein